MRSISETARDDIALLHGGLEWAELVDITLPDGFNPSASELKWMSRAPDGGYHILVTSAAAPVCLKAAGWRTYDYTDGYKVFFNVPYTRDAIEDANENGNGLVKTRITLGDTSGTVKAVMDRTYGLCGLRVDMSWAMVCGWDADEIRALLGADADGLSDREAAAIMKTVRVDATGTWNAWSVAAIETGTETLAVLSVDPASGLTSAVYNTVAGWRHGDPKFSEDSATLPGSLVQTTGLTTSMTFDDFIRGNGSGLYIKTAPPGDACVLVGVGENGTVWQSSGASFPASGGGLTWFAMSDALRLAMRSLASEVFGLPAGSVFARTPDLEYHFVSGESVHDRTGFSFQLSTKNPLAWRFPPRTIYKAACQWVFKSPECGYTGAATSCRKTIAACRALNNIARIGCFPGCGSGGLAQ